MCDLGKIRKLKIKLLYIFSKAINEDKLHKEFKKKFRKYLTIKSIIVLHVDMSYFYKTKYWHGLWIVAPLLTKSINAGKNDH